MNFLEGNLSQMERMEREKGTKGEEGVKVSIGLYDKTQSALPFESARPATLESAESSQSIFTI